MLPQRSQLLLNPIRANVRLCGNIFLHLHYKLRKNLLTSSCLLKMQIISALPLKFTNNQLSKRFYNNPIEFK